MCVCARVSACASAHAGVCARTHTHVCARVRARAPTSVCARAQGAVRRGACLLFGVDKPRLRFKNNEFRFFFLDSVFRPPVLPDSKIVYFYWSPDLPEMLIKQAQITKQFWTQHHGMIHTHKKNKKNPRLGILLDNEYGPAVRQLYPHCRDGTYLTWKPTDMLLLERDRWLVNSNTAYATKIQSLVDSYIAKIRPEWYNNRSPRKGLIGYVAGDYLL